MRGFGLDIEKTKENQRKYWHFGRVAVGDGAERCEASRLELRLQSWICGSRAASEPPGLVLRLQGWI